MSEELTLANGARPMECGDLSPLSAGDLSPSSSGEMIGNQSVLPLARGKQLPWQNHAGGLQRRQVACGKRRELAALHNIPALPFTAGNSRFVVGRLDGTLQFFDAKTGQPGKVGMNK